MPVVPVSCPNCNHAMNVQISVETVPSRQSTEPRKYEPLWDSAGRINLIVKYGVASQLAATEPGDYSFADLYAAFNAMVAMSPFSAVSPRDYAKLLRLLGCVPYRAANHRGYTVRPIEVHPIYSGQELLRVDVELVEDPDFKEDLDDEQEPADEEGDPEVVGTTDDGSPVVVAGLAVDESTVIDWGYGAARSLEADRQAIEQVAAALSSSSPVMDEAAVFAQAAADAQPFEPPAELAPYMRQIAEDVAHLNKLAGMELPATMRDILASQSGQVPDAPKEA